MSNIKLACKMVSQNLGSLTYEDKRFTLKSLDIKVRINHYEMTIGDSISAIDGLPNLNVKSRCLGLKTVKPSATNLLIFC